MPVNICISGILSRRASQLMFTQEVQAKLMVRFSLSKKGPIERFAPSVSKRWLKLYFVLIFVPLAPFLRLIAQRNPSFSQIYTGRQPAFRDIDIEKETLNFVRSYIIEFTGLPAFKISSVQ
ncbi:hypothetical protein [Pseudanabaena sp. FACHB-2040]|uniref:hypothetical protein n=1 Tax=Pseudanabaena sp. FACHB-2040 TaxID=2692859 RepID=UPI001687E295|nr:hypothetical protein [Pseudanabaena sp. FACHB-2040]MBD2256154.1 hypothetical protein [Pseudanabaena sp. FACHB-2040]